MDGVGNEIASVIQELANQLGVAADNILGAYAPYYMGVMICSSLIAAIVFVVSIIVIVQSCKAMIHEFDNGGFRYTNFRYTCSMRFIIAASVCVFACIVLIISFVCVCVMLPDAIGAICSPSGATINHIISMVSQ